VPDNPPDSYLLAGVEALDPDQLERFVAELDALVDTAGSGGELAAAAMRVLAGRLAEHAPDEELAAWFGVVEALDVRRRFARLTAGPL